MSWSPIAIIGAGFSGALFAINLVRHAGPAAILIERGPMFGRGTAYAARHDDLLLNVRASSMSALPDQPGHFVEWLEAHHPQFSGRDFVPRRIYGDYLAKQLLDAVAGSNGRLTLAKGNAVAAKLSAHGVRLDLEDGRAIDVDAVALAVGNLPPHPPPGLGPERLGEDHYVSDPWSSHFGEDLSSSDCVLLLGTGLTMVDVALSLEAEGFQGHIVALSRRGLLPRAHGPIGPSSGRSERPTTCASRLLSDVRARSVAVGWRAAVDELRPFTQNLWRAASTSERERFLRHLRPWWDVHRHRLAPAVADRLTAMQASGALQVEAGNLVAAERAGSHLRVIWRRRGGTETENLAVRRIINCTGPQGDLARTTEPLLQNLLDQGLIRPDPCRLGLDVDAQSQLVDASGGTQPRLLALGPMTRGAFWEITAVPDIRQQSWAVARRLSAAHWVGGEGL